MILSHDQWQNGNVQKMCEIGTYPQYRGKVEGLLRKRIGSLTPVFNRDGSWSHDVPVNETYVQNQMKIYDALWEKTGSTKVDYVEKKKEQIKRIKKNQEEELFAHEEEFDRLQKTSKKKSRK